MSRNSSCGLIHYGTLLHGEGNGNPLQCSCLENPRDGGAWWAAVYGVAQSGTRLKRLSSSPLTNVTVKQSRSPLCISTRMSHIIWCLTKIQLQENPSGSVVKNPTANMGDACSIPGSGRASGERNSSWLQYSYGASHKWLSGKESVCQCRRFRRCEFDPWVRKMPWRRK